jgi:hypothetical protein
MRMFRRLHRRARCKNPNRNHLSRNRRNCNQQSDREGKSRSPLNRNLPPGTRTAVGGAGAAVVVEAGAVAELNQSGLPDKRKQALP